MAGLSYPELRLCLAKEHQSASRTLVLLGPPPNPPECLNRMKTGGSPRGDLCVQSGAARSSISRATTQLSLRTFLRSEPLPRLPSPQWGLWRELCPAGICLISLFP